MNKLMTVISETYSTQVKSKSFIALLLMPIIFILVSAGAGYLSYSNSNANQDQIAVVADANLRQPLINNNADSIDSQVKTEQQARQKMKTDDIYGYLTVHNENGRLKIHFNGNQTLDNDLKGNIIKDLTAIQSQINIKNSKLTREQVAQLSVQPSFSSTVKKASNSNDSLIKIISLQVLIIILYFFLLMYSGTTASVIAKEKGAKLTEIIFSSTTATTYFLGKIIGIILVMLTQFIVYAIMLGGSYKWLQNTSFMQKIINDNQHVITQVLHNLINVNALFVIIGLIMCILISAVCGALVARKEDANKATQPIVFLIMILFFAAQILQNNSDGPIAKVLSYFPLSSVFFMPIRIINNQVGNLNIIISLLILIISTVGLTYWITSVYKGLMLQSDDQSWFKNLISGIKYR